MRISDWSSDVCSSDLAIHSAFGRGVDALSGHDAVETLARGPAGEGANQAQAALFGADAAAFARDPARGNEVFGSSSIVVRAADPAEIAQLVGGLEGQIGRAHVWTPVTNDHLV